PSPTGGEPFPIELIQTHISSVFLTPRFVYKFKRPVNLGFADFTGLENRRHFCHEELRLNRRLAPKVYLEVVPLWEAGTEWSFEGGERVVDYAVVMVRLPRETMLDSILTGRLDSILAGRMQGLPIAGNGSIREMEALMEDLADHLARFHRDNPAEADKVHFGLPQTIRGNWDENFAQVEPFVGRTLEPAEQKELRQRVHDFLACHQGLLEGRAASGHVVHGHGDLRAEHIQTILKPGGGAEFNIIDCVEFTDRFRYGDAANDLAFLLMDLAVLGHPDLSRRLMARYVETTGDSQALPLMGFYCAYRAAVRGKVLGFRLKDTSLTPAEVQTITTRARSFFHLALTFARRAAPPALVLMTGLMGSGKSSLAAAFAHAVLSRWNREEGQQNHETAELPVINSDVVRKQLAAGVLTEDLEADGGAARRESPWGEGIYTPEWTERTYAEMMARAARQMAMGRSVVLDGSFARQAHRLAALALARRFGAEVWLVECKLEDEAALARLKARYLRGGGPSDGRPELLSPQKAAFEPVEGFPPGRHVVVNTTRPSEELAEELFNRPGMEWPPPVFG
ncbi:MAG: AAA family ATPase, partial [Deltaproteobacteria bacterium]|nr:AAA family ATPase [Deltaproteobacteria bacterium]